MIKIMITSGKNYPSSIPMTSNYFQSSPKSLSYLQGLAVLNYLYSMVISLGVTLLIMGSNTFIWVSYIFSILNIETFLSWDFMSLYSSYQFSTLSSKHGSNYQLYASSLFMNIRHESRRSMWWVVVLCWNWMIWLWGLVVHVNYLILYINL
jgi:hypothetical protein